LSLGLGGKFNLAKNLGIRVQGRWVPTFISSESAVLCTNFGGCYVTAEGDYLSQVEVSGGLILKF